MSCENIEAISHRLDIENQEPLAKDTREIDEFITQQKFDDAIEGMPEFTGDLPKLWNFKYYFGEMLF